MKYKTKPIDYTGCDPIIAEYLKRGKSVLCDCVTCSGKKVELYVRDYFSGHGYPYITELSNEHGNSFQSATPIEQTQYVKKASEIMVWLEDNGYQCNTFEWWKTAQKGEITFEHTMVKYCGKEVVDEKMFLQEWLEYK